MAIIAMLLFYPAPIGAHAQSQAMNSSNLTKAINSTESFLHKANQSGYLVFYPDLSQAYHYLKLAENQTNESNSYVLLAEARSSAQAQIDAINTYRAISLYALIASAILLAALLYAFMMPHQRGARGQN